MVTRSALKVWYGLVVVGLVGCSVGDSSRGDVTGGAERFPGRGPSVSRGATASERARLAGNPGLLSSSPVRSGLVADSSWAEALDVPGLVTATTLGGAEAASRVRNDLGIIKPVRGGSFILLSTGVAGAGISGAAPPEPGTDFGEVGTNDDATSVEFDLTVPDGANSLSFQYNFLSTESPDFIGTIFNDTFSVRVIENGVTREFTVATVNDSHFFEASDARAEGAGFDIYATDPSDLDAVFGTGLPDAGLTDFQSFSIDVTAGSAIKLMFAIQDNGDGIVDSAVLLDALRLSAIDVVDPNPDLLLAGGAVTGDVDDLATLGRPVLGAVADGATDVLLRVKVDNPGAVAFTITGSAPQNGTLSTVGGGELAATVSSPTVTTSGGEFAFAVYRAPANFNTGSDAASVERGVTITAAYTPGPGAGSAFSTSADLQIKRPPLVTMRGLWSNNLYWTPLVAGDPAFITNDDRFVITHADRAYGCTAEVRVVPADPNAPACPWDRANPPDGEVLCSPGQPDVFSDAIREALDNSRRLNIAATEVDVVAHGDAGIRAREFINARPNRSGVNRLITVNTPHLGSEVANAIVSARDAVAAPIQSEQFMCNARRFETLGNPPGGVEPGDIDAITPGALSLAQTEVPSHALVGNNGRALNTQRFRQRAALLSITMTDVKTNTGANIMPCAGCTTIWGAADHDLFSTQDSQQGGLPDAARTLFDMTTVVPPGRLPTDPTDDWTDYYHIAQSRRISDRIIELLNTGIETTAFGPFPAAALTLRAPAPALARPDHTRSQSPAIAAGTLRIVSPVNGAEVFAGDTIQVEVIADGGFIPATVAAVLGDSFADSDTSPFTIAIAVPARALGPTRLIAVGTDASDQSILSNLVVVNVRTNARLDEVNVVTRNPFLFGIGRKRQLAVTGIFDDAITRDLTSPIVGTQFLSSNPGIVAVSPTGVITSVAPGIATVVAQNGSVQDSVSVTVVPNAAPIARAGADANRACVLRGAAVPVQLDGSGSFDPDGDSITFAWFEAGLPIGSVANPVVQLAAGIHTITLAVSDSGSHSEDTVVVSVTEDAEPPHITVLGDNPHTTECGRRYHDSGATARDVCDGDLTASIATDSTVDTRVPGSYTVDYSVTDRAGLNATASRSVIVADRTPPVVVIRPMIDLFPPDLRYRRFTLSDCARAFDACGRRPEHVNLDEAGEIVAIHSDEPDVIHRHDPDHDIVILGPSSFKLRSQRSPVRNGRVYEVEFTVRDERGNRTGSKSCFFGVKRTSHSGPPINDGRIFTVRP
jgi:hypothetical protein